MPQFSDVTAVAIVALIALICGLGMARLRQPAVVGYILAGLVLGPAGLGLVRDHDSVDTLAEFGVLMLLFLTGMHLDLHRFVRGWTVAVGATVLPILGSVAAAGLLVPLLQWNWGQAILFGFIVSVSSTAVVLKLLEDAEETTTPTGRTVMGILIAQDMAVVPMMLVLSLLSPRGGGLDWLALSKLPLALCLLVAVFWLLLKYKVRLPFARTVAGHRDLSPLTGLAWCFGAATLSELMGLSPSYGAFLAGVVIGNSDERHALVHSTEPIQSVLLMVFFLSVGLMLDLKFVWAHIGTVLSLLLLVTVFKTVLNIGALRLFRQSWTEAFLAGIMLAQIGEFSFVLADIGRDLKLIGRTETRLAISVTVLSLILAPLWLMAARRLHRLIGEGAAAPRDLLRAFYIHGLPSPVRLHLRRQRHGRRKQLGTASVSPSSSAAAESSDAP